LGLTGLFFDPQRKCTSCQIIPLTGIVGPEDSLLWRTLIAVSANKIALERINFTGGLSLGYELKALLTLPTGSMTELALSCPSSEREDLERFLSNCTHLQELRLHISSFEMIKSIKMEPLTSLMIEVRDMDYDSFKEVLQYQPRLLQIRVTVLHIFDKKRVEDIIHSLQRDRLTYSVCRKCERASN